MFENIISLLEEREFVSVATVNKDGRPNAAPKFILKIEPPFVYLVDHIIGQTYENIQANRYVSISFMDSENLEGYRLNGQADIIKDGKAFETLSLELHRRFVKLSASRVIEGVKTGKKNEHFEIEMPDKFVILKIRVEEATKIGSQGDLWKERTDGACLPELP